MEVLYLLRLTMFQRFDSVIRGILYSELTRKHRIRFDLRVT
jgi:hypothetical protein